MRVVLCALVLGAILMMAPSVAEPILPAVSAQTETALAPPSGGSFYGLTPQFAVSPDGRQIVFVGNAAGGPTLLWLREVGADNARPLPGTDQASYPFWSADNRFVGFFSGGKLKKAAAEGGSPAVVCDAPNGRGGTWNADGVIVFASGITDPLQRVSAAGGQVMPASVLDKPRENSHRFPQFLPDGRHFLFWAGAGSAAPTLKVGSLASTDAVAIGSSDTNGAYAADHLFFGSGNALIARRFDASALRATGDPIRIVEPLSGDAGSSFASFAVSATGTLLYARGTARPFVLTWFDRTGRVLGRVGEPGLYTNVALSPDDTRIAVSLTAGAPPNRDVWVLDAATGAATRLTTHPAVDASPVWSPDGTKIAYSSQRDGPYQIYVHDLAANADQLLFKAGVGTVATDWSRGGSDTHSAIAYVQGTRMGLWYLPGTEVNPVQLSEGDNLVSCPANPNIAYQSSRSGRPEIYFVHIDANVQVSTSGGTQPLWRHDGKELFFLAPDGSVMAADPGQPAAKLFPAAPSLVIRRSYAVSSDGQRVLMPVLDERVKQAITVIPDWKPRTSKD